MPERLVGAAPDEHRAGYPSLPYSMLVWPLPPYYLPPAPLPPPPDRFRAGSRIRIDVEITAVPEEPAGK